MILNFLKGFQAKGSRSRKETNFEEKVKNGSKLHTVRWDIGNRWKEGVKIHFSTGAQTSKYNCFKEGVCTGTQKIEIKDRRIWIDNKPIITNQLEYFIMNDGFDSEEDFWAWFDQYTPFKGKVIHWTDLRY